jgi:tRNA (cmo5U34)-methyltransferase
MKTHFDQAAKGWDQDPQRVRMAESIAEAMIQRLQLRPDQVLLDYGAGTGLIALKLLPFVRKVVAVDTSQGMLDVLGEKLAKQKVANVEFLKGSVENTTVRFPAVDVIVSSMALHHVQDTEAAANVFWAALRPGGQMAIADLDEEDGAFHTESNAAMHKGFNRLEFQKIFAGAGFEDIRFHEAYALVKPLKNGKEKTFPIFLMTARKRR